MTSTTLETLQPALSKIFLLLGDPRSPEQVEGLDAYLAQDAPRLRVLAASHLADNYLKTLGYLASVPKLPPTLPILLSEAARSAADHARDRNLVELSKVLAEVL